MTSRWFSIAVAVVVLGTWTWVYSSRNANNLRIVEANAEIGSAMYQSSEAAERREAFGNLIGSTPRADVSVIVSEARILTDNTKFVADGFRTAASKVDAVIEHADTEAGRTYWTLMRDCLAKYAEAADENVKAYSVATDESLSDLRTVFERATPFVDRAEAAKKEANRLHAEAKAFRAAHWGEF